MKLPVCAWPQHDLQALLATLPRPLGELPSPPALQGLLAADAPAPLQPAETLREAEALRAAVRDLLRPFGYRPTGRGKPSSEYLANAAADGRLGSINAAVDAGNAVSLHAGLPISVVDLDRLRPPLAVAVPGAGSGFVFNQAGQQIDVAGLPSLHDADGPCANAVKDSQRSKTSAATVRLLAIVWGSQGPLPGHAARAAEWLGELLRGLGAAIEPVAIEPAAIEPGAGSG